MRHDPLTYDDWAMVEALAHNALKEMGDFNDIPSYSMPRFRAIAEVLDKAKYQMAKLRR